MTQPGDQELIRVLKERFEEKDKVLHDLRITTSKLEELNHKLQESEALRSHFLSNVRNEINNPLTAISGLAQHLMGGKATGNEIQNISADIYFEAFNLDFQLQNIFAAAELEAGEASPFPARVDVANLITGTLETFSHHQAKTKNLTVHADLDAVSDYFVTDAEKLRIILANLLANAIEFSPPAATVEVSATLAQQRLFLAVRNSGVRLDEAVREQIFDRFRQLDMGTTKQHRGQGLGLSVCRSLAELLDGELNVTTDDKEGWCQFELSLAPLSANSTDVADDANVFLFDDTEKF